MGAVREPPLQSGLLVVWRQLGINCSAAPAWASNLRGDTEVPPQEDKIPGLSELV